VDSVTRTTFDRAAGRLSESEQAMTTPIRRGVPSGPPSKRHRVAIKAAARPASRRFRRTLANNSGDEVR
jgi:hypothetical protein